MANELAYVPTRMALEQHTALEYDLYLLLQQRGAADEWVCIRQIELARTLAKSLSSIRRALRRLAEAGYVAIRHRVVIGGRMCATVYRALYGEGVRERVSHQASHDVQPLQGYETHAHGGDRRIYG